MPTVFPACVVTRAQSHKGKDVVDLSEMFIAPQEEVVEPVSVGLPATSEVSAAKRAVEAYVVETVALSSPTTLPAESEYSLKVGREQLIEAQRLTLP